MVFFMKKKKGFTFIELLIVIAIIGMLTAIAFPSYQEHIRTANRIVAQLTLTKLAQQFERTSARQGKYPKGDDADEIIDATAPPDSYTLSVVSDADAGTFTIAATPIAGSVNDGDKCGDLSINQAQQTTPTSNDCWN
ncbi:MAG: type IV pilus assembly protein PilE [Psychromonas sp.]|jgi:type IV pilus assembly protein PilE